MGSITSYQTRSGKRWSFCIDLGPPVGGKRQQLRRQGFKRRLDAERAMEAELPAIRAGTARGLADRWTTLSEYLDQWFRIARNAEGEPWRPSTVATYRTSIECYLRP